MSLPNGDTMQIQHLLEQNVHLIRLIEEFQNNGNAFECMRYQRVLYNNLLNIGNFDSASQTFLSELPMPPEIPNSNQLHPEQVYMSNYNNRHPGYQQSAEPQHPGIAQAYPQHEVLQPQITKQQSQQNVRYHQQGQYSPLNQNPAATYSNQVHPNYAQPSTHKRFSQKNPSGSDPNTQYSATSALQNQAASYNIPPNMVMYSKPTPQNYPQQSYLPRQGLVPLQNNPATSNTASYMVQPAPKPVMYEPGNTHAPRFSSTSQAGVAAGASATTRESYQRPYAPNPQQLYNATNQAFSHLPQSGNPYLQVGYQYNLPPQGMQYVRHPSDQPTSRPQDLCNYNNYQAQPKP